MKKAKGKRQKGGLGLPLILVCCLLPVAFFMTGCSRSANRPVAIGAKKFTESIILAEMGARLGLISRSRRKRLHLKTHRHIRTERRGSGH